MSTSQTPIVVGIFEQEEQARHALDTLKESGFGYDQVGVATHKSGAAADNLRNDLMSLGISQERATFYDNEFRSGHTVVSVRPDGRESEVSGILRGNGAYDYPGKLATGQVPPEDYTI